jgi:hypothetical protein
LPVTGPGFVGSGDALQHVISDLVNPERGSSLALAQKAVFVLHSRFTARIQRRPGPTAEDDLS